MSRTASRVAASDVRRFEDATDGAGWLPPRTHRRAGVDDMVRRALGAAPSSLRSPRRPPHLRHPSERWIHWRCPCSPVKKIKMDSSFRWNDDARSLDWGSWAPGPGLRRDDAGKRPSALAQQSVAVALLRPGGEIEMDPSFRWNGDIRTRDQPSACGCCHPREGGDPTLVMATHSEGLMRRTDGFPLSLE